jgi:plasmid stabilization system protein ParE
MIREVVWSEAAEQDLDTVLNFLNKKWAKKVVVKFINKLDNSVQILSEQPSIFPIIN